MIDVDRVQGDGDALEKRRHRTFGIDVQVCAVGGRKLELSPLAILYSSSKSVCVSALSGA